MFGTTSNMNIRMDKDVKEQAQRIFSQLGMDMTTAVNVFLRQVIRSNGLPFELRLDTPNEETLAAIREVQEMKKDPSVGKAHTDVDEMMKELCKSLIFHRSFWSAAPVSLIQRLKSPLSVTIPLASIARTTGPSWIVGRRSMPCSSNVR